MPKRKPRSIDAEKKLTGPYFVTYLPIFLDYLAVEKGLRSQLGIALYQDAETLGGLNMYSINSDTIDPQTQHMAELFAAHAAIALGHAQHADHLHTGLISRQVIGQAVGIIMERY